MGWRVTAVGGLDTLSADERELFETALNDDTHLHVLRERHLIVYEMEAADDLAPAAAASTVRCVAPSLRACESGWWSPPSLQR